MWITLIFMAIELGGGWWANSLALISDGVHMFTDVGALLLSLFALWMARRPANREMTFGYHRAEILGALASGLLIWLIAGVLVVEAVLRLREPPEVEGRIVAAVAAAGLVANLVSLRTLATAKDSNINVRAAYVHMVSDSLGNIGAMVAGVVLWLTGWRPIDPIMTILFAILMLYSSWSLIAEAVGVLMESTPRAVDGAAVETDLRAIAGVTDVHDLHIWSVSAGRLALSVHLIATTAPESVLSAANKVLDSRHKIHHTTIQIEHPDRFQSDRCYDCGSQK